LTLRSKEDFFLWSKDNRNDKTMAWVLTTSNPGTGRMMDWRLTCACGQLPVC